MNLWPQYYILVGRTPVAIDREWWALACEKRYVVARSSDTDPWKVARDKITNTCTVSTVFLGLNHSFDDREPILFETLVFGGPLDGDMKRYATYDQAERGHAKVVAEVRIACAKVDAIAKQAGAG